MFKSARVATSCNDLPLSEAKRPMLPATFIWFQKIHRHLWHWFNAWDIRQYSRHQGLAEAALWILYTFTNTLEPRASHPLKGNLHFEMPALPAPTALRVPIKSVVSSSFLYPFKGVYYFFSHPSYYPLFGRRLIPLIFVSILVFGFLFVFTYLPQVAFLAIFHGHLAWFNAVFLVLGEGQILIALLFEALLVDETLVNVFDVRSFSRELLQVTDLSRQLS